MTIYTSDNTVQIYDCLTRVEFNSWFKFYNKSRTTMDNESNSSFQVYKRHGRPLNKASSS